MTELLNYLSLFFREVERLFIERDREREKDKEKEKELECERGENDKGDEHSKSGDNKNDEVLFLLKITGNFSFSNTLSFFFATSELRS